MNSKSSARELVRHDGLKDSLTGLMSFPAFLDSATREIKSARRSGNRINLFMLSLLENNDRGTPTLAIRPGCEISEKNDDQLYDLAARVLVLGNSVTECLRSNDLVARYTFADLLILTTGYFSEVNEKLVLIGEASKAALSGIEIRAESERAKPERAKPERAKPERAKPERAKPEKKQSEQEELIVAIATLEQQLLPYSE